MIIGIDEVGRGPLAGPVITSAVLLPPKLKIKKRGLKIKDSKKLTAKQRLQWYQWLKTHPQIKFAVARCQPTTIDRLNISQAANLASYRALIRLTHNSKFIIGKTKILLDGGLKLPSHISHKTIIKGDEKYNAIKLASILAKVTRDKFMEKKHKLFPQYGFIKHKGYGTKKHIQAIKKHGPCSLHRLTFISKFVILNS